MYGPPDHYALNSGMMMDYSENGLNVPSSNHNMAGGGASSPLSVMSGAATPSSITAQSPGGTLQLGQVVDTTFVQHHNLSVEIYQSFKDDVDLLFSGGVPLLDQHHFISRVINTLEGLIPALNQEKQYLMNDVLCSWAFRQQKYSIGSAWTQQMNYNLLSEIDTQFEYFGELLEQTLSGLSHLISAYPNMGFEELHGRVHHIAHLFLFYSIIVSKQPPSVAVKCGEAENHRRSRFWFNCEIRILGGRAFGLHKAAENAQVQCFLITDRKAKELRTNGYLEVLANEHFNVEPAASTFRAAPATATSGGFVAQFPDMRVLKGANKAIDEGRREKVWEKRYHLCYNIQLSTAAPHNIALIGKKVSLPFAILVGPKAEVEARVFLERSFADFVRRPESEPSALVNYSEMADALEMKFQAILEIPQKPTDQVPLLQPRAFSPKVKEHLIRRLQPDRQGQIALENFLKMPVAEEYCLKKGSGGGGGGAALVGGAFSPCSSTGNPGGGAGGGNADEGEWKLVPFYEWFFKSAELVNKQFLQMWNAGLIFGFCGKDEAEQLLSECHHPTLLIRFSDIEYGKIKISVRDHTGVIRHHWYDYQDLSGNRALETELIHNAKYRDVEYIYPNINLAMAIGQRDRPPQEQARKPRTLRPSPVYFDNQEAAIKNSNSF